MRTNEVFGRHANGLSDPLVTSITGNVRRVFKSMILRASFSLGSIEKVGWFIHVNPDTIKGDHIMESTKLPSPPIR